MRTGAGSVIEQSLFAALHESESGHATEIHVPWNVGDQGKSGLVVLNVSFVARDP